MSRTAPLDGVALVTGAASGIGLATARALHAAGMQLVLCDIDEAGLEEAAASMERVLLTGVVDVGDREQMESFAADVHTRVPGLDVLVNNAGVGLGGTALDLELSDWEWVLRVNLWGVIHGCHFFGPPMAARGRGHIVNVSSMLGFFAVPGAIGYATSKFAVFGYSEALRAELHDHGVGVSTICPGVVDTGILRRTRMKGIADPDDARQRLDRAYNRRGYGPEKVARAIVSAIRHDKGVVPVTPESWAAWWLKRASPGVLPAIGRILKRHAERS